MDSSSQSLVIGGHSVRLQESGLAQDRRLVTIDVLPDNVLVEIFNFHEDVGDLSGCEYRRNWWHALVHVCRRWRYVVFASPRRLNLRLTYHGHRPMMEVLDTWPVLPLSLISIIDAKRDRENQRWDNMVAGLESEYSNRISEINISGKDNSRWERFAAAMQKPFPELTLLKVWTRGVERVLPDSFLAGSAPRLRTLWLERIPFPSIPKLLLSANGLVELTLQDIPHSGYFSPDAIATALAVMTRLESLRLRFSSHRSRPHPETRPLPPPTRFVLPALTQLIFKGVYEYLEDLLARINAPHIYYLSVIFFMDLDFDAPQLRQFICHAEEFKKFNSADVTIYNYSIRLCLHPNTGAIDWRRRFELQIICPELDDQLLSLTQVCNSFLPLISTLEELWVREHHRWFSSSHWKDDMENTQWLELLAPFTALKNLYLTDGIAHRFGAAIQELSGEGATKVLPTLRNLFVGGSSLEPVQETLKSFVTARQLSGQPVVVDRWGGRTEAANLWVDVLFDSGTFA